MEISFRTGMADQGVFPIKTVNVELNEKIRKFSISMFYYKEKFGFKMQEEGGKSFVRKGLITEVDIDEKNGICNLKVTANE